MVVLMKPTIIQSTFSLEDRSNLLSIIPEMVHGQNDYESSLSRFAWSSESLNKIGISLEPLAKKIFNSDTLKSTYSLYVKYIGNNANLFKHIDSNACTYTIDYCLRQKYPWDLWIENTPYTLFSNESLCYLGETQEHWREKQSVPTENFVEMIFFHFVEPTHWYFTRENIPPQYT